MQQPSIIVDNYLPIKINDFIRIAGINNSRDAIDNALLQLKHWVKYGEELDAGLATSPREEQLLFLLQIKRLTQDNKIIEARRHYGLSKFSSDEDIYFTYVFDALSANKKKEAKSDEIREFLNREHYRINPWKKMPKNHLMRALIEKEKNFLGGHFIQKGKKDFIWDPIQIIDDAVSISPPRQGTSHSLLAQENLQAGSQPSDHSSSASQNVLNTDEIKLEEAPAVSAPYIDDEVCGEDGTEFQAKIQQSEPLSQENISAIAKRKLNIIEGSHGSRIVEKNGGIAKAVLAQRKYICQVDHTHDTFTTPKNERYMEGHHLIPCTAVNAEYFMEKYERHLDCESNIVCICPNCHRAIHLGNEPTREKIASALYDQQAIKLKMAGISITKEELLALYKIKMNY